MSAAFKKARQQARATGQAKIGRCIIAEMSRPYWSGQPRDPLRAVRVREIETIIRHRHGAYVPDPSGTDDVDQCHAYLTAVAGSLGEIRGWARRWMPWLQDESAFKEAEALQAKLQTARRGERLLPADAIGRLLMVRHAERDQLGLTTIGCCDLSKDERESAARAKKRLRDRERQRAKRKVEGRIERLCYIAGSAEATRPWEAAGVSRATWYRQRKSGTPLARETGPSRAMIYNGGDTPVSPPSSKMPLSPKGERTGFGDKSPAEIQEAEPRGASYRSARHG
jgi:hypothetical protein